jgi:copper oxidase (laccase) domain-containing protein
VPAELRAEVAALVPQAHAETSWGTPALDLGAGVLAQLAAAGVPAARIRQVDRCTLEDEGLHSHRRDGDKAGRLAGLVWFS